MKVALVQMAPRLGDVEENIRKIKRLINGIEAQLFVLPELANSGYRFKNIEEANSYAESVDESLFINALVEIAKQKQAYLVSGFCEKDGEHLYNSAILIDPKGVLGYYRKLHLFLDEKDIFTPGDKGLPVFDTEYGKIAMLVCFDWMFPEVWRQLALQGAQLILHPSNLVLPYCQSVVPSYALVNRCFIATCNRVGKERDLCFTGQSVLADPQGEVLVKASEKTEEVKLVDIDLDKALNKKITPRNDAFEDRRTDVYGNL